MISRRLAVLIPTLLFITIVVFLLEHLIPGGVAEAIAGPGATARTIRSINARYGLDRPLLTQYLSWIGGALHGDLGTSFTAHQTVVQVIVSRLEPTAELVGWSIFFSLLIGVLLAVYAARYRQSRLSSFAVSVSSVGVSIPQFWAATLAAGALGVSLHLLPATGFVSITDSVWGNFKSLIIPVGALSIVTTAVIFRFMFQSMCTVLESDYIRSVVSCGAKPSIVLWRYAVPNAMSPVVTIVPIIVSGLVSGSVVVESVVSIPGLGSAIIAAVNDRDYPTIQGIILLIGVVIVVLNVGADMFGMWVDPRTREL